MLNNIRGILNRRAESQSKSPEGSRIPSEDDIENNASSMEGFLCPSCKLRFPAPEDLQDHYESTHSERELVGEGRIYSCSVCKMKCGSEIELNSHYSRHHSSKEDAELESMALQVKALEEGKALLQGELQAFRSQASDLGKENNRIREERDNFKLEATKLADDLTLLKEECDELKAMKASLETAFQSSQERIKKLEVEIHQRPEADDVSVLQKELVAVQKMMNDLTLQREAEKDLLQAQCNSTKETCLQLQAEKTNLENELKNFPKKEEFDSLKEKSSEQSNRLSQLQLEFNNKESERKRLQNELNQCSNYQEIKTLLSERNNALEESQRLSADKDVLIEKLKADIEKIKESVEEMKVDREKLFSKIEEGEGANAAMLQLREENARLQEQLLQNQQLQGQAENEHESKLEELRASLKSANSLLLESKQRCVNVEKQLAQINSEFQDTQKQKDSTINDLKQKVSTLTNEGASNKALINELRVEIENRNKLLEQKDSQVDSLKGQIKEEKISNEKRTSHLELEKQSFEKRLSELGNTLPKMQADLMEKENKLVESEKKLQKANEKIHFLESNVAVKEKEIQNANQLHEKSKSELESLKKSVSDFEAAKIEFCDKIYTLNEEKLKIELKEAELNNTIEQMQKEQYQLVETCTLLEEESKNLRSSNTTFLNEKNSLLNNIEEHKRSVEEFNIICSANERKISELSDALQKTKADAEKVLKDASIEKKVYLEDKMKLQKQIENLQSDCAKKVSESQEMISSLKQELQRAEKTNVDFKSSIEKSERMLKQKDVEWEEKEAHHIAQIGVLTQNIQTLREDLTSEQKRRETLEQKLDETCGLKLELEAKLENALDERKDLLERYLKSEADCERLQKSSVEIRRKYDDCVAALQELGRENQTLQVENMKLTNRKWADDTEVTHCTACGKLFTVTIRKHHCRNCGCIFCNECSAQTATVAASKKPVRVCDICHDELLK